MERKDQELMYVVMSWYIYLQVKQQVHEEMERKDQELMYVVMS